MIKVIIVDDHQLVIDGIQSLLKNEQDIVCEVSANSGEEAFQKIQKNHFDIVLLDIGLPEMDGIKVCKFINDKLPTIKVIALTMMTERSMIKAMLEAGAHGYLLKNVDHSELVLAIKRVYNGKKHYSDEIADILIQPQTRDQSEQPKFFLSRREKEILGLIVNEYTTSEIADKLFISVNTVETHRKNIMQKLDVKNSAGMVRKAMEFNLIDAR